MNVGNFLSYVPNRTFATHADMATVEKGLQVSPWGVALALGIPFAIAILHFLIRILPSAQRAIMSGSYAGKVLLTLTSTYVLFVFFGSSGLQRYGDVSHWIAVACRYVLFPASLLLCWPRRGQ